MVMEGVMEQLAFFFYLFFIHFGIAVVDDTTKRSGFENRSERIAWIICNF